MGLFDRFKKTSKESLLGYLKNSISDNSSLEHIVSVFEEMCNMPLKEDMILFETGTYSFTGKPMFNFSLVRQFPNDEEEYYQIHVDVLYIPTEENKEIEKGDYIYLNGVRYSQTSKLENYKISNVVICTSDSGRKLYEIEEYPDYEYIAGYYAWDGVIYKKDETDR